MLLNEMNTPRTNALNKHIHAMPKTTSDWIEWAAQYAELSRQLETQVQELREALEMALDASENCINDKSWEDSARAAIAKAKGQGN